MPENPNRLRCQVCAEPVTLGRTWTHLHSGEEFCHTGDGATATVDLDALPRTRDTDPHWWAVSSAYAAEVEANQGRDRAAQQTSRVSTRALGLDHADLAAVRAHLNPKER